MNSAPDSYTPSRYIGGAIAFHWLMFFLVVVLGTLGLLHDSWPKQTQSFWINIHALLGLLLWLTLMARFWWRRRHRPPPLMESVGEFLRRTSAFVHYGLYALLFITPIVGIITFVYHGRVFDFGFSKSILASSRTAPSFIRPKICTSTWRTRFSLLRVSMHWLPFGTSSFLRDRLLARMWPARH